jgi:hypothetical protein
MCPFVKSDFLPAYVCAARSPNRIVKYVTNAPTKVGFIL